MTWIIGDWRVEPRRSLLVDGESQIRLEPQMMEVLLCLVERPGEVISRDELIDAAWHGRAVTDEALSVAIHGLRKSLGDSARSPKFIETVPRRGYRWVAPVSRLAQEPRNLDPMHPKLDRQDDLGTSLASRNREFSPWWQLAAVILACALVGLSFFWLGGDPAGEGEREDLTSTPAGADLGSQTGPRAQGPGRPLSDEARRAFELGYMHIMRLTPEDVEKARKHFERCIELEPSFAPAWAGLSAAFLRSRAGVGGSEERQRRARKSAEEALRLDPELPGAHVAMARIRLLFDWHPLAAQRHLRRALELDPLDAHTYQLSAAVQLALGYTEAAESSARKAVDLEPAIPVRYVELADILLLCDRPEAALVALERALELDPRLVEARIQRPFVHLQAGRHELFYEGLRSTWDSMEVEAESRSRLQESYQNDGIRGLLTVWVDLYGEAMSPMERANLMVIVGEADVAFELLEACVERRCTELLWLDIHPTWKGLRGHPEFVRISQQIRGIRKS